MQNIPLPSTNDSNLVTALILLNREIEELKKQIAELKAKVGGA